MGVNMNLRIIKKNHAAEIGFLTKSISKPKGRATAMPTAWDLNHLHLHIHFNQKEGSICIVKQELKNILLVYEECSELFARSIMHLHRKPLADEHYSIKNK